MKNVYVQALATLLLIISLGQKSLAFQFERGTLKGSLDTTLTVGAQWRTEPRDPNLVGIANGGRANTVNGDDGNLNYDQGRTISRVARATHDLQLDYKNYGAFLRASYSYDDLNYNKDELTADQRKEAGSDFDLLDAFVHAQFEPGGHPWDIRLGNQVLSWGQSTFIQNGVNVINPVDLTRLRTPGSELKEALVPTPMIASSLALSRRFNLAGFYLLEADQVELDVCGTYFATSDLACRSGANVSYGGWGRLPEESAPVLVRHTGDRQAPDNGQFGLNLKYLSPLLTATEFELFYLNYHSRLPYGTARANYVGQVINLTFDYPKNIELYGAGFNTQLGRTGIAFQGEYSHRRNLPLAVDDMELIGAAYLPTPTSFGIINVPSQLPKATTSGQEVKGYRRYNVGQWQGTLSKFFGPRNPFFADRWGLIMEAGATNVYGMPKKNELRFDGPGTSLPGQTWPTPTGAPGVQREGFADAFSWGYVFSTQFTYYRAVGPVNLTPRIAFAHDVNGTTPAPISNFIEDRKALTIGLGADYFSRILYDVSFTRYYGAGPFNLLNDRDFVGTSIKYVF